MEARGLGVRELARRVPCNAGYVTQLRNGQKRPSEQTARRLDDVLDAAGRLTGIARQMAVRPVPGRGDAPYAPFAAGLARPDPAMRMRLEGLSAAQAEELVAHLGDQWHVLVKADNLLGPRHALGGVTAGLGVISALLRTVRPPVRKSVLGVGARYAESAAWLYEDSADRAGSRYWARQALEWALEGGDRLMVSWALFRASQHACADRDAPRAADLAAAARRQYGGLPGLMVAAILQQQAHVCAMDGNERGCHRALDRAHLLAAAADDPGDASAGHGSFCTPAYLEMQRGGCWLALGRPERALTALDQALVSLPPAYRRDRGVGLSWQAAALAAAGEHAEAARVAMQALGVARDSGSGRVLSMIVPVAAGLDSGADVVDRLRSALAGTPAV
jgi:tetratricopeptide (TPR) repeat protein